MGDTMNFLKYFYIVLLSITAIVIIFFSIRSRKPIKFLFINACLGLISLFVIHFTKSFTGADLPINEFTVISSSFLGVPSVIGFLLLNFILM